MGCPNHPSIAEWLQPCARCGTQFCSNCLVLIGGAQYCGQCKREVVRDVQSGAKPGAADLASIWLRFAGMFLDQLIMTVPIMLLACVGGVFMGMAGAGTDTEAAQAMLGGLQIVLSLLMVGVLMVYEGLMLSRDGQTLGKKACKTKVVSADGTDITTQQAWLRAFIRMVFGITCLGLVDLLPALFTAERTTIHDMVAKTRVVKWS